MWNIFPTGPNPIKASIPVFLWTEAIIRGKEMTVKEGLRGVGKLESDLKMIWSSFSLKGKRFQIDDPVTPL